MLLKKIGIKSSLLITMFLSTQFAKSSIEIQLDICMLFSIGFPISINIK